MARTQILPSDPGAIKLWESEVAVDARKKSFFTPMTGGEKELLPVVRKTSLESGPGDEVTMYLVAKIVGKPVEGQEKLAGREKALSKFTDKMRIDKHRQAVNVGDVMDQKRVPYDIAEQAKARLSDYAAEVHDEQITMHISGGRGHGPEVQHYPVGYRGFPNPFIAPDAKHYQVHDGSIGYEGLTPAHKLGLAVIDEAVLRAKKMLGDIEGGKPTKMQPIQVEGGKHFLFLTGAEGMRDLRRETGDAGWLALEKAKATAVGAKSPIFQGGAALYNDTVIDEAQTIVKFNNAGADGNVNAMRSLLLGAHGVAVAFGTKSNRRGTRYELSDSDLDHGEEEVIVMRLIAGYKKCVYNGMDFGCVTVDHAYTPLAGETI
jgi:N4-gp56 family major capsid protein